MPPCGKLCLLQCHSSLDSGEERLHTVGSPGFCSLGLLSLPRSSGYHTDFQRSELLPHPWEIVKAEFGRLQGAPGRWDTRLDAGPAQPRCCWFLPVEMGPRALACTHRLPFAQAAQHTGAHSTHTERPDLKPRLSRFCFPSSTEHLQFSPVQSCPTL